MDVEFDVEEVEELDVLELLEVALDPELCVDVGVAEVELAVVAWESAHAIAPPSDSIAATLPAATARRARQAFGLLRSVAMVSSFAPRAGSQSGATVRSLRKTGVNARTRTG
jgi:hypothetical protein